MLIPHKGHTDTIQVYSVTVMTHVKALQAGHSSQGTSEPITPAVREAPKALRPPHIVAVWGAQKVGVFLGRDWSARNVGVTPGETQDARKVGVSPGETIVARKTGFPRTRRIVAVWMIIGLLLYKIGISADSQEALSVYASVCVWSLDCYCIRPALVPILRRYSPGLMGA